MKVQITTSQVIPAQSLENKLLYLATIEDIFPCDKEGRRLEIEDFKKAEKVRVQIKNLAGGGIGHSAQVYTRKDFEKFIAKYSAIESKGSIGSPVISVYTKDRGQMLSGLIPLGYSVRLQVKKK